jgi:hypothetical protein
MKKRAGSKCKVNATSPNVSELLVWYEIECIGKMQAQRGGHFEITWELIRTNFNVILNE